VNPYYQDDAVTIYHGDCREVLASIPTAGMVLVTDPPYGTANASSWDGVHGDCSVAGDDSTLLRDAVLAGWEGPAVVFGSWKRPRPTNTKAVLIWDKGGHAGMGDLSFPWKPNTEEIYVIGPGFAGPRTTSVLSYWIHPTFNAEREHPTQKPVELMRDLISKCPPLCDVVDPFMGSGTTLRAAKDCGRHAVGIEIDERYCEIAARRMAQEVLPFA
jgi:site-specific DNA-methyltransferase (adenine-specific)